MNPSFVKNLKTVIGADNVLTSSADRFLYAYESGVNKAAPGAVVLPRSAEEVSRVVRLAWEAGVPYVARGAGTNLCGAGIAAPGGLVIHLSRLNRICSIDPFRRRALLEPGVVNLHLQKALEPHGLFYAPDPASQKACTLGGNVGTNAGGPRCLKYGVTSHHVLGLDVILPDGNPARVAVDQGGYDLTGLWVGSEGTLGIITQIEVNLLPVPEDVQTLLAAFPSMEAAAQAVSDIIAGGIMPSSLELVDRLTVEAVEAFIHAGYPKAEAVLLIELDGKAASTRAQAERIETLCRHSGATDQRRARDEKERDKLWEGRRGAYAAMARLAPNVMVEDGVVPRTRLPEALRRVRAIARRENIDMGLIAHAGDGNLHPNMIFDERDERQTEKVKRAGQEMLAACVELGGAISGEHGIGLDKREAMKWIFSAPTLSFFRRMKTTLDPRNLCNPDKILPVAEEPPQPPPQREELLAEGPVKVESVERLRRLLAALRGSGRGVFLRGMGTQGLVLPPGALIFECGALNRVTDHDRENYTISAQAGLTLKKLREYAAGAGQYAHVEGEGTLGGVLSAGGNPRLRNEILGLKAVLLNGDEVSFGAKVMKNVAGYDAAKLFIGAWGTLGVITEVTLRLYSFPGEEKPAVKTKPDFTWVQNPLMQTFKRALDPHNQLNPVVFGEALHA